MSLIKRPIFEYKQYKYHSKKENQSNELSFGS